MRGYSLLGALLAGCEKRGLWQDPNPVNPYEWRKRKKK